MNAWQDILAIALVLAAGAFVAWRAWLAIVARRGSGCASACGKCPSPAAGPVLQIGGQVSKAPDEAPKLR